MFIKLSAINYIRQITLNKSKVIPLRDIWLIGFQFCVIARLDNLIGMVTMYNINLSNDEQ